MWIQRPNNVHTAHPIGVSTFSAYAYGFLPKLNVPVPETWLPPTNYDQATRGSASEKPKRRSVCKECSDIQCPYTRLSPFCWAYHPPAGKSEANQWMEKAHTRWDAFANPAVAQLFVERCFAGVTVSVAMYGRSKQSGTVTYEVHGRRVPSDTSTAFSLRIRQMDDSHPRVSCCGPSQYSAAH